MREQTTAKADQAAGMNGGVAWHVIEVHPLSDCTLMVRFADGTAGEVDLSGLLASGSIGVFEPLRDPAFFRQVRVEHGAVTWPGELDLAPDAMYDDIRRATEEP